MTGLNSLACAVADQLKGNRLEPVFEHWQQNRGGRCMPRRRSFDPSAFPPTLLPVIVVAEPLAGRLKLRLVGTEVVARLGYEPTGKFVDEAFPGEYGSVFHELGTYVVHGKRPVLADVSYVFDEDRWQHRQLLLPFSDDDSVVSHVMGLSAFSPKRSDVTLSQKYSNKGRTALSIIAEG